MATRKNKKTADLTGALIFRVTNKVDLLKAVQGGIQVSKLGTKHVDGEISCRRDLCRWEGGMAIGKGFGGTNVNSLGRKTERSINSV